MASIGFVVGDPGSLLGCDTDLETLFEGDGHTVTFIDDGDAEVASGTYDVIVISASADGTTLGTKYDGDYADPVLVLHHFSGVHINLDLVESGAATGNRQSHTATTVVDTTPLDGYTHTSEALAGATAFGTLRDYASNLYDAGDGLAFITLDSSGRAFGVYYGQGDTLADGTTVAGNRRAFLAMDEDAYDTLTAAGQSVVLGLVDWAVPASSAQDITIGTTLTSTTTLGSPTVVVEGSTVTFDTLTSTTTLGSPTVSTPGAAQSIGLVVGNSASLTDADSALQSLFTGNGDSVTVIDDTSTQVASGTHDCIVISPSVDGGVLGSKYGKSYADPVVSVGPPALFETTGHALMEAGGTTANRQAHNPNTITLAGQSISGLSGSSVAFSTETNFGSLRDVADNLLDAGETTIVATHNVSGRPCVFAFDTGDEMNDNFTLAPNRRVWIGLDSGGIDDGGTQGLTTDGETLILSSVTWATGGSSSATLTVVVGTGITSTTTLGSPAVVPEGTGQTVGIGTSITSTTTFSEADVVPGPAPIDLTPITSTTTFGSIDVLVDAIIPDALVSTTTFGSIDVLGGPPTIGVDHFTSTTTLGEPAITPSLVRVVRITSTTTFGSLVIVAPVTAYRFETPTRAIRWNEALAPRISDGSTRGVGRWFSRSTEGVAVLLNDGTVVERWNPTNDELQAADAYWLGGRTHTVSADHAAVLAAAGYTVTEVEE